MRVLFAGGGTGGHLYPGLAIARALVRLEPSVRPFFVGARRGIERDVLPDAGFPFELLSDEERVACELFGVWKEKSMYGRKYMGVERSTFLIDGKGVLRREWRKVKVPGHADVVLAAASEL